jgi:hypothetical protein
MASGMRNGDEVRHDLARRIDAIDRLSPRGRMGEIVGELEFIRRAAVSAGLHPAVTVIHAIDSILSRGERGPRVQTGLAILRDAIDCDAGDARACESFAATCSVRLGG